LESIFSREIGGSVRTIELIIIIENSSTGVFLFENHREIIWCQARGSLRFYQQIISNVDNNIIDLLCSVEINLCGGKFRLRNYAPSCFLTVGESLETKINLDDYEIEKEISIKNFFHPNNSMEYTTSSLNLFTGMLHALTVLPLRLLTNRKFSLSYESQ
jgi:hypothetical protein